LTGSPFGGHQPEDVEALVECARENHGHSGRAFVRQLLDLPSARQRVRDAYNRWRRSLGDVLPKDPISTRRRAYVATLLTTAELLDELYGLPSAGVGAVAKTVLDFFAAWAQALPVRDQARESFESFTSWCLERRAAFLDGAKPLAEAPDPRDHQSCLGVWDTTAGTIAVLPTAAQRWEKETGYPLQTSLRLWLAKGWVQASDKGHLTKKVPYFGGRRERMYVLTLAQGADD
jgi:hypothetical protein